MATSDYNITALKYKQKFDDLNRPTAVALVPEDEEFNRDELLHFIGLDNNYYQMYKVYTIKKNEVKVAYLVNELN